MRWLFVTNIPSPYQIDFFTALHQAAGDVFHVIFTAPSESDRQFEVPERFDFSCEILPAVGKKLVKDWHANPMLSERLATLTPELVVLGGSYFMPDARTVRRFCQNRRIPWIYWGENPFKRKSSLRSTAKWLYLRWFLHRAAGAIGIGSVAAKEYQKLLPGKRVTNIPYAPELTALLSPSAELLESASAWRRRLLNSDEDLLILFSGSLNHRKAPDLLLEAFAQLAESDPALHLVFAGAGPMRAELEKLQNACTSRDRVHFAGFQQGCELQALYLAADVFVLPTRTHEGWGVVVQEAMAAGKPVVVSRVVGAAADLVSPGVTGLTFHPEHPAQLLDCLRNLVENRPSRIAMGAAGREAVQATASTAAASRLIHFLEGFENQRQMINE